MSEKTLREALIEGNATAAKAAAEALVKSGKDPLELVNNVLAPTMREIGKKFEKMEIFLSQLMLSGDAAKSVAEVLQVNLAGKKEVGGELGIVVLGTAKGDIHSIGKDIMALLLTVNGFKVIDLGVDVDAFDFVKRAEESKAKIIGVSALMSNTMPVQRDVIELLKASGNRDKHKVLIGGCPVTAEWANEIGADGWAIDAPTGLRKAKELLTKEQ